MCTGCDSLFGVTRIVHFKLKKRKACRPIVWGVKITNALNAEGFRLEGILFTMT